MQCIQGTVKGKPIGFSRKQLGTNLMELISLRHTIVRTHSMINTCLVWKIHIQREMF